VTVAIGVAGLLAAAVTPAGAQDISVNFAQGSGLTERVIQMVALLTVLSLAPSILVMMTSFTRIVVVLSLLRTALGTATAPPNAVIVSLALFLTAFVMGPALQKATTPACGRWSPTRSPPNRPSSAAPCCRSNQSRKCASVWSLPGVTRQSMRRFG
jgi:flagellar biosynthesis protein FliP